MPNTAIVIYEQNISTKVIGAAFGPHKIVPRIFNINDKDIIHSVGSEVVDPNETSEMFLSGYFVSPLSRAELEKYFEDNFQPPDIPKEILENIPEPMRKAYNVRSVHDCDSGNASALLIWKPNVKDSDAPTDLVLAVIHAWNKFAASLVNDGLMVESNKINVASAMAFREGNLVQAEPHKSPEVRQLITFDCYEKSVREQIGEKLSEHALAEVRNVNIFCGWSIDPFEHFDG